MVPPFSRLPFMQSQFIMLGFLSYSWFPHGTSIEWLGEGEAVMMDHQPQAPIGRGHPIKKINTETLLGASDSRISPRVSIQIKDFTMGIHPNQRFHNGYPSKSRISPRVSIKTKDFPTGIHPNQDVGHLQVSTHHCSHGSLKTHHWVVGWFDMDLMLIWCCFSCWFD